MTSTGHNTSRWLPLLLLAGASTVAGLGSGACGGGATQARDGATAGDARNGSGGRTAGSGGSAGTGGVTGTGGGVTGSGGGSGGMNTGSGGANTGTGGAATGSGGGASSGGAGAVTGSGGAASGGRGGAGIAGGGGTGTATGGATGSGGRATGGAGTASGGAGGGVSSGGRGGATVGTGGAAGGTVCGTSAGCPSTHFCDFPNNSCGTSSVAPGMCKPRPQACPANVAPTCACDHQVYSNSCLANTSGQDASDNGGCTAPAGKFACGSGFCNKTTEYCMATIGGALGVTMPGQYGCIPFPASCAGTPTCACLKASNCTMSADGDVRVTLLAP